MAPLHSPQNARAPVICTTHRGLSCLVHDDLETQNVYHDHDGARKRA